LQTSIHIDLSGMPELTAESADALSEATGGDIELNVRDGIAFVEFERSARALRDASTAGIREVEGTGLGLRVIRVDPKPQSPSRGSTPSFMRPSRKGSHYARLNPA
jgi:hypothetical protein